MRWRVNLVKERYLTYVMNFLLFMAYDEASSTSASLPFLLEYYPVLNLRITAVVRSSIAVSS